MFEDERELLCRTAALLFDRGLVSGADGNISMRPSQNRMLVTPSGVGKGMLTPDMLLMQDFDGKVLEGSLKPTREAAMHSKIYERRPEIHAVIHTHPPAATAFALCGQVLPEDCLIEVGAVLGKMGLAPYAPAGSLELAEAVEELAADYDIIFLKNHGIITCGSDLNRAFLLMDSLENAAKTLIYAKMAGTIQPF